MAEIEDLKQSVEQREEEIESEQIEGVVKETMKPWEQHSAVISIPRFDYNAPSTLLRHSHTGFLITCPIKREKSATKEAISILGKYIVPNGSDCLNGSESNENVKKRKLDLVLEGTATTTESELSKDETQSSEMMDNSINETSNLKLVKVTRSGLILFTFAKDNLYDPVSIVSDINQSVESGALKRPLSRSSMDNLDATMHCITTE